MYNEIVKRSELGPFDLAEVALLENVIDFGALKLPNLNRNLSIKVELEVEKESNSWLNISLTEGKNREIRNIMEHLGLQVNRLIRTSFGPFVLGNIQIGELREINKKQLESFIPKEIL